VAYDMKSDKHRDVSGIERVRRDDESQECLSGSGDYRVVGQNLSTLHDRRACQGRYEALSSASAESSAEQGWASYQAPRALTASWSAS
jgi:hypothetical protein